jgi:hypothetical protein
MSYKTAADSAKQLLQVASQRLHTVNPTPMIGRVLEDSMPLPPGDAAYAAGQPPLEPNFSEVSGRNLAFMMNTVGPYAPPADRLETATQAMRWMVNNQFGPEALYWLDGRIEPVKGRHGRGMRWGARYGAGFDRHGVMESLVTVEWGPELMDSLPPHLYRLARLAMELLPGLRPAFSTIRCGRRSGSQQITFAVEYPLALSSLKPLMDQLGLGHQHAGLMSATAFLLGARFTLPPHTAMLTLLPTNVGPELRLDVNLDALPDPPQQMAPLLSLQMGERPTSLRQLEEWLTALTPDNHTGPGTVTVLSIRVRPDMAARVALYLRPAALSGGSGVHQPGNGTIAAPSVENNHIIV